MLIEEYEHDVLLQGQYFKKNIKEPISTITQGNGVATLYDEQGIFLRKVIYHKGKPLDPES
jgi:antitoxin component YwqK of YwqJK toxin-antitoxin module